jgi:hypothetical protein
MCNLTRGATVVLRAALLFLLVLLLAPALASAGTGSALRETLAGLDPASMPSPILYDRVVPLAALPELDGTPQAPPVTPERWRQALFELTLASSQPMPWPTTSQIRAEAVAARGAGVIPLAVLDVSYGRFRPEALASGLLIMQGGRLVAVPGARGSDLYAAEHAFAVTALVTQLYQGSSARFVLSRRLFLSTSRDLPSRLEVDFADGQGLRAVAFDQPVQVSYPAAGSYVLCLRAIFPDGRTLCGRFPVDVRSLRTPAPTETWPLTADIPYQGSAASGEAFVYLADGHATVTNPIVVVEGFDLDDSMGWEVLYTLLNQENLIEDLHAEGYDAVILNFASATDPIQRNAFLLVKLLQTVQATIPSGQAYPLIGASMGGLVSRYALAYMEQMAIPHQVATFIAFDTPNRGANIPLGLQYWLDFFQDDSADAAYLLSRLDTPAARQLLLYHHTSPPGSTGVADPMRADFVADLAARGDFPATPRLVAIANGSGAGIDQGFAPGDQIIRWEYGSLLVDITGNIWAVPNGTSQVIFDGEINLIWPLPDKAQTVTVSGTLPWDNAPGGSRASMTQMDEVTAPYGDIIALHPAHAFIPTISALGLDVTDPFYDIAGDGDLLSHTSFDAVFFPQANQDHILITPENKAWFLNEIHGAVAGIASLAPGPVLFGAFPNPSASRTTIAFELPAPAAVRLEVFDAVGRHVRTLAPGVFGPGLHEVSWNGRNDQGREVASGVFLYRLDAEGTRRSGRLTLVR